MFVSVLITLDHQDKIKCKVQNELCQFCKILWPQTGDEMEDFPKVRCFMLLCSNSEICRVPVNERINQELEIPAIWFFLLRQKKYYRWKYVFQEDKVLKKQKSVPEKVLTDIPRQDYLWRDGTCCSGDRGTLPISALKSAASSAFAGGPWRAAWSEGLLLIWNS